LEKNEGAWINNMNKNCYALLMLLIILISGCSEKRQNDSRIIFTSIVSHQFFVQKIAGDRFDVFSIVESGQSPHSYAPTPGQIAKLSNARIYFRTGVEFEEGVVPKIKKIMPSLSIVDMRSNIELIDGEECEHDGHEHHHGVKDPHIWLSPVLMKTQVKTILESLCEIDPAGKAVYEENYAKVIDELNSLDSFLKAILAQYKNTELFVFHPGFGYFAKEYGLIQKAVETGGKEPSAKALVRLIEEAKKSSPKVMFVQPQYSQKSAQAIAEQVGCVVVSIDPLPVNYYEELRKIGKVIKDGLVK
jgi:zinc transport system substrate-binding protein